MNKKLVPPPSLYKIKPHNDNMQYLEVPCFDNYLVA